MFLKICLVRFGRKGDVTITAILKNSNQDSGDEGKEAVFSL